MRGSVVIFQSQKSSELKKFGKHWSRRLYCINIKLHLPKQVQHRAWSILVSLRPSISCLNLLLPRLPVPSIFPSITWLRKQFLHKMRPTQLAFLHFTVCRKFFCFLTFCNSSFSILSILSISIILQHHVSKFSRYFWLYHIRSKTQNGCCRVLLVHLEFLLTNQTVSILDPRLPTIPNTCTNTTTTAFAPLNFWGTVALYVRR